MRNPNIFLHFPQTTDPVHVCPVCGTNEDAPTVLVGIDGTEDDGNIEALLTHLNCAIATRINSGNESDGIRMLYTYTNPE